MVSFPASLREVEIITTDYSNELPNFHTLSRDAAFLELTWNYMLCDFRGCIGKLSVWISLGEGCDSPITSVVTAPVFLKKERKERKNKNKTKDDCCNSLGSVLLDSLKVFINFFFSFTEFSKSSYKVILGCSSGFCRLPKWPLIKLYFISQIDSKIYHLM